MLLTEELNKKRHNRKTFDCGLPAVNDFLQQKARQQAEQKINRTWVALDEETAAQAPFPVVGYFTLTLCTVAHDEMEGNHPHFPMPAIKLAWFGVDQAYQGNGTGTTLLIEALLQSWELVCQTQMGVALLTDPLTDESRAFFEKYDFRGTGRKFQDQETLYMPMKWIRNWVEQDLETDACDTLGNPKLAQEWMDTRHPRLDHRTPRQMIDVASGVEVVQDLLYSE